MKAIVLTFLLIFTNFAPAGVEYREFANADQQEIYETLIKELRCLVCQNQTIADSNAELAADLRRQVYEMVQQGKTRNDIVNFLTERYGDFVLYNPPFKLKTGLLWLGPMLFILIGLMTVFLLIRKKKSLEPIELNAEQRQKIRDLLEQGDRS